MVTPQSRRFLDLAEYTVAEAFADGGYHTGFIGKWHLGLQSEYWPAKQGFAYDLGAPNPGPPSYFSPYRFKTIPDGPKGEYITDRITDEAIDYLKAQSLGRVSFVPKEEVRCLEATPQGNGHSRVTSLTSVVRAKEGYEPFVRYLLGNTLVVEDLSQGLELWRTNNINSSTLVTLEGDIIDPTGIITGGVQNGSGSSFLKKT